MDRRPVTTVAPQALLMMNSEIVRGYAEALARRVSPSDACRRRRGAGRLSNHPGRLPTDAS